MSSTIFVLNGPNLNLLGQREIEVYGPTTMVDIEKNCTTRAKELGASIDFRQSNHEGVIVDWIQEARDKADGIVINAAALTHTSQAIPDALRAFEGPIIEVHLSNIFAREEFRHHSTISVVADSVICGCGEQGYIYALDAAVQRAKK